MQRQDILNSVVGAEHFHFWTPVITHYRAGAEISIDAGRMARHAQQILPHTPLWMVGGTTGDGWALSDRQYAQLLDYICDTDFGPRRPRILVGALRPTTSEVLQRVETLKQRLGLSPQASLEENLERLRARGVVGVTICAPVGAELTQAQIGAHLAEVCARARLPIVLYQLPQITHNLIASETLQALIEAYPAIILFKDSGGKDEVARTGLFQDTLTLVRGAEGDYLEALKGGGGCYDGWLLSTGNAFAPQLAVLAARCRQGDLPAAAAGSRALTAIVQQLFSLAGAVPGGNPFSNANRAADHLLAYGKEWRQQPLPLRQDGSRLPADFLEQVEKALAAGGWLPEIGYLP